MGVKGARTGGTTSKFDIGLRVRTPSGLSGRVIGLAECSDGWWYNVRLDGASRYFKYRKYRESQLRKAR